MLWWTKASAQCPIRSRSLAPWLKPCLGDEKVSHSSRDQLTRHLCQHLCACGMPFESFISTAAPIETPKDRLCVPLLEKHPSTLSGKTHLPILPGVFTLGRSRTASRHGNSREKRWSVANQKKTSYSTMSTNPGSHAFWTSDIMCSRRCKSP